MRPDVIIIGAGAGGLAAAKVISEAGRSALVLEARARFGGRILTLRDERLGVPLEMGPEFIHGRPEATWDLVKEFGLVAYDLPFDHFQKRRGRLTHLEDFEDQVAPVMGGLTRLGRRDMSFAGYVRKHHRRAPAGGREMGVGVVQGVCCAGPGRAPAEARKMALAFVQGFDAADPERISAKSLAEEMEGVGDLEEETQFRLADGYGALVAGLVGSLDARRVEIRLKTTVREVRWKRGSAEVWCEGRRAVRGLAGHPVRAPRVIVTLPLGVLQLAPESPGAVRFSPEIAGQRRAMGLLASGPIVKIVMKFKTAFWESKKTARLSGGGEKLREGCFMHAPDEAVPTWWTARPLRVPVLAGWAGGPKALALTGRADQAVIDAAVGSLAELFGLPRRR